MKASFTKQKIITPAQQWVNVKKYYSDVIRSNSLKCGELIFRIELMPSKDSIKYLIEIRFRNGGVPIAYMIEPDLKKYKGKLPKHLYSADKTGKKRLCVYDPTIKEWNCSMYIAETFIPWVLSWLNTYEYWLITGKWEYNESSHSKK